MVAASRALTVAPLRFADAASDLLDLVDEYGLFVYPAVLGGGTAYFPSPAPRISLRPAETRTFGCGVVHLRYER